MEESNYSENTGSAGKRTLHDTSIEDTNASKTAHVEEEVPSWAKALLTQNNAILGAIASVNNTVELMRVETTKQREEIDLLKSEIAVVNDNVEDLRNEFSTLSLDNDRMKGEIEDLKALLDEQIDRGLRDHLTFFGIPKEPTEKYWEDTTKVLASWLAAHSTTRDFAYFDNNIERCHRGGYKPDKPGPPPIFCKFRWRAAEEIRGIINRAKGKMDGVIH